MWRGKKLRKRCREKKIGKGKQRKLYQNGIKYLKISSFLSFNSTFHFTSPATSMYAGGEMYLNRGGGGVEMRNIYPCVYMIRVCLQYKKSEFFLTNWSSSVNRKLRENCRSKYQNVQQNFSLRCHSKCFV